MQNCNKFIICENANLELFIRKSLGLLEQGCKIYNIEKKDNNLVYSYGAACDFEQIFLVLTKEQILLYSMLSVEETFNIFKALMKY